MFELEKYRGVMFDGTEDWCKVWRKNWPALPKVTWEIWKIFTRALESLKIGTFFILLLQVINHKWKSLNKKNNNKTQNPI